MALPRRRAPDVIGSKLESVGSRDRVHVRAARAPSPQASTRS
jgi:hypothetical protein